MQQVFLRTFVILVAAVLAYAAPAVCADAEDQPLQTRPIADFLEKQGQHLTKGIVPEFMSFTAYFNPQDGTNRAVSIDYAGLGARVIRKKTAGAVSLHTKMDGLVYERQLPDGRAEVTIQLHTRNALTFVIEEPAADYDVWGSPSRLSPSRHHQDYERMAAERMTPRVGSSSSTSSWRTPTSAPPAGPRGFLGLGSPLPGQN